MGKIVLVDDDSGIRKLWYDLFKREGHQVITAPGGQKLIELLNAEKPELVVLDFYMSDEDGLTVLDRIMENQKLPVIIVSGGLSPELKKQALAHGARAVFEKTKFNEIREYALSLLAAESLKKESRAEEEGGYLLIVDDEIGILKLLGSFFEHKGFTVKTAESGEEALRLADEKRPQLVMLDVTMPGMDGVLTLKKIHEKDASIPVIMVTGVNDEHVARETIASGAYAYVLKPFDMDYLNLVVTTALVMNSSGDTA